MDFSKQEERNIAHMKKMIQETEKLMLVTAMGLLEDRPDVILNMLKHAQHACPGYQEKIAETMATVLVAFCVDKSNDPLVQKRVMDAFVLAMHSAYNQIQAMAADHKGELH